MRPMRISMFLAGMACSVLAADLNEERIWRGSNGKSFRGTFNQIYPDGTKVMFITDSGKVVTVALDNLVKEDRDLILKSVSKEESKTPDAGAFKPEPQPDRTRIPVLDPKQFDCSSEEEMVDALWVSLLWWNQEGVVPIPGNGKFEKKAEWLHKSLSRLVAAAGRSAATLEDARKGSVEYFKEELKDLAACRAYVEQQDLSPTRLCSLARGANAVIVKMTMTYDNGRDFSACAALESMSDAGRFVIHLFGKRLTGQVKTLEKKPDDQGTVVPLEFVLDNRSELPESYQRNGAVFKLGLPDHSWNGVLVLKPYVYAVPGKTSPLPADNEFKPETPRKAPVQTVEDGPKLQPRFPINFSSPVEVNREWLLTGGRKFQGSPLFRSGQLPLLKSLTGQQVEVSSHDFMPEDRAIFELWLATTGQPQSPPRMDLTYRLDTPALGSIDVNVAVEGSKGRIEVPEDHCFMVFDMEDGAFVSTRMDANNDPRTAAVMFGRFDQEYLLKRKIDHFCKQEDLDRLAETGLAAARKAQTSSLPARFLRYPLPSMHWTFRDPEMDFVLMENPVVLAALSQFLCMHTTAKGDKSFVFHTAKVPWNQGVDHVFPVLASCHVLPVSLRWTNVNDASITTEENRRKYVGKFSLRLIRASVPDAFPDGHFAIPEKARTMAVGSDQQQ